MQPKDRFFGVHKIIFVIGLISLLTDLSSEMIVPILPLFLTSVLHVQVGAIGIIEGVAEGTASLLKLFSGWLSDRIGHRKPLMVAGYGLSNIIKPFFALTTTGLQVMLIRFIDRFGKGIRGAPRDALIADFTTKQDRGKGYGFHRAMDTLGASIGPLAAFAILDFSQANYRLVFWASAIPGLAATLTIIFLLKEKKRVPSEPKRGFPRIRLRNMDSRFIYFTLVATLFALGNSSNAFLILQAQQIGMKDVYIPLAYLSYNLSYAVFSIPAGMLSDRIGRKPVIIIGYFIFALIYLGFALVVNSQGIWWLFISYGLYYAATEGVQKAFIADVVPEEQRGTAIGTFNAFIGLATVPASVLAGMLWQLFGPLAAFTTSSYFAVLAGFLMLFLRSKK